jgi:hypothetical protein
MLWARVIKSSCASILAAIIILVCFCFAQSARAQSVSEHDSSAPHRESDAAMPVSSANKPAPMPHRFWDRTNLALFSGIAVTRAMDYASTRNFQARGRQEILLPDEVVNNSAGFASLEAAGTMTSIGISYLLHRTGHHTLERWMSIGHIGVTAFGDIRNYSLKTRQRAQ